MPLVIPRESLQAACRAAHGQLPDHCGFMLIVVPFGSTELCQYASNIRREDAVKALKELLFRWGVDEKWMEEAK